jgi:cytosine/adenosine deaminase-related metal-dependent hydrolase
MKAKSIVIKNAWICQVKSDAIQPIFGDIDISGNKITDIHSKDFHQFITLKRNDLNTADNKNSLDAGGRIVTVPLINYHDHFYSRLAKGLPLSGPLDNFIHILENLWWKLDNALDLEMVKASVQMAVIESIRQGVTYIFDHHSSPNNTDHSLSVIAEVLKSSNIRGVLCFETSNRKGDEVGLKALKENRNFIETETNQDILGMLGMHAPFTLSNKTLEIASKLTRDLQVGIHIHLAEDVHEKKYSQQTFGMSPVERLHKFNLLTEKSILAHAIHLDTTDLQLIEENGSAIVYNLDSNLNNAVGLPVFAERKNGFTSLLGTDGMHANIARSFKQLFLISRNQGNSFDFSFQLIEKVYLKSIKYIRSYFPDFSNLQKGDRADLIVWNYVPPTPFTDKNFWSHFIYGIIESNIHSVLQGGKFLLRQHQIVKFDESKILNEIYRQGERLYHKL